MKLYTYSKSIHENSTHSITITLNRFLELLHSKYAVSLSKLCAFKSINE